MSPPIDRSLMPIRKEICGFLVEYNRLWRKGIGDVKTEGPFSFDESPTADFVGVKGCYLIYTKTGNVTYIGMSDRSVAERLRKHMSRPVRECQFWKDWPGWAFEVVRVRQDMDWEAAALEAFLNHSANTFA